MRALWITAAVTLILDQALKAFVLYGLDLISRGVLDVVPPFLNLRMAWNTGINFGLFSDDGQVTRWVLIGVAVAISAWVAVWMHRERPPRATTIAAGLLIGGALGNALDRVIYGAVADFLNMSCCGIENPYAFNLADIAIFLGAVGLVILPDTRRPARPRRDGDPPLR